MTGPSQGEDAVASIPRQEFDTPCMRDKMQSTRPEAGLALLLVTCAVQPTSWLNPSESEGGPCAREAQARDGVVAVVVVDRPHLRTMM